MCFCYFLVYFLQSHLLCLRNQNRCNFAKEKKIRFSCRRNAWIQILGIVLCFYVIFFYVSEGMKYRYLKVLTMVLCIDLFTKFLYGSHFLLLLFESME